MVDEGGHVGPIVNNMEVVDYYCHGVYRLQSFTVDEGVRHQLDSDWTGGVALQPIDTKVVSNCGCSYG